MKSLVTVTDLSEAKTIFSAEPDIVDIKNPEEGSLGCPGYKTAKEIISNSPSDIETSIALGDMPNIPGTISMAIQGAADLEPDYIKIGLKEAKNSEEIEDILEKISSNAELGNLRIVISTYAELLEYHQSLPELAAEYGFHGVMIDTLSKDGRNLFEKKEPSEIRSFLSSANSKGLMTAVAGSLDIGDIQEAQDSGAEVIGVRGAICGDGRNSRVSPKNASEFIDSVKEF